MRGLNDNDKIDLLKKILGEEKYDLACRQETKHEDVQVSDIHLLDLLLLRR